MTFRVIDVELRAQDAPYIQGLHRAAGETKTFVRQVEESGRAASTAYTGATKSTQQLTAEQAKAGTAGTKMGGQISDAGHKAGEGLDHAGSRARLAGDEVTTATKRMAEGLSHVVQTALGFEVAIGFNEAITKLRAFTVEAVKEGINLNVTMERTRTIFGQDAEAVIQDVERMGRQWGTNNAQMLKTADIFGVVARGAGLTGPAVAELSTSLTHVAADTAAFWRQSPDQVMVAIRSGLLGMTRGIKAYGVELSTTAINQKAVELGLGRQGQALTEGEKVQARAAIIQEQLANTTGYLARNTETFAGQLRLLRGHLANFIEEAGAKSLPVLSSMLLEARHLGSEALPILDRAIQDLSPTGRGLVAIGEDLWKILLELGHAIAPVAVALGALGGAAIIQSLNLVVTALAGVTHFLADHREVVIALAGIYAATLIPRVIALGSALADLVAIKLYDWLGGAGDAALGLASAEGRATLATGLLLGGIGLVIAATVHMRDEAHKSGKELADSIYDQPAASLTALRDQIDKTRDLAAKTSDVKPRFFHFDIEEGPRIEKANAAHKEAVKQLQAHETAYNNWSENLTMVAATVGTTTDKVERMAQITGTDLSQSIAQSGPERQKLINDLKGTAGAGDQVSGAIEKLAGQSEQMASDFANALASTTSITKLSSDQLVSLFGDDAQAVKDFGDEVQKAMDATRSAWTGDADVISAVSQQLNQDATTRADNAKKIASASAADAKSGAAASDAVLKAQERLNAVEDARGRKKKLTVADDNALADAQRNLAKAQDAVATSSKGADVTAVPGAIQRVTDFYKGAIDQAKTFSAAINEATQRGVDPQLIARLLEAGPKTAGPVLDAMLSDHSGNVIRMVNESEQALQTITEQAVEMARLTALAVKSPTDKIAGDLKLAMQAAQREAASGGTLTAAALATALGVGLGDVQRIMQEYGVSVANAVNPVLGAVGAPLVQLQNGSFASYSNQGERGPTRNAYGGFYEDHSPVIARGGPTRVWNEPETGGEAYIPLAPSKRASAMPVLNRVASEFGVKTYAAGGIVPPPGFEGLGEFGIGAHDADEKLYEAALHFLSTHGQGAGAGLGTAAALGSGKIGHGWPALVAFLSTFGDPFTVTSTTGGKHAAGSLHYAGRAVDVVGANMLKLAEDFLTDQGDLAELFHTPLGFSIKNGRRVAPIAAAEHYNHVHAASYDAGGMLPPGLTMAWNGTGRPEPVGHTTQLADAIGSQIRSALVAMPKGPLVGQQVFNEKTDPMHVAHATAWVTGY